MAKQYIHKKRKSAGASQYGYNNNTPKQSTSEQIKAKAAAGNFDFQEINGFRLIDVEYKMPPKPKREAMREQFKKEVRPKFLKYLAENCVEELKAIGITDAGLAIMRKGQSVNGFNVHHKLPIAGGGTNDFKNLIIMPIPPHDELHHLIIDPQIKNKSLNQGVQIKLPWSDDMVWKRPSKTRENTNAAAMASLKQKQGGR